MCKKMKLAVILALNEDIGELAIVEIVGKLKWSSSVVLSIGLRWPSFV
jgi:hypothetical protein